MFDTVQWDLSGPEIEAESFRMIEEGMPSHSLDRYQERVARRLIHTTGDFSIMEFLQFGGDPIVNGLKALQNKVPIFCDSNMIRAGVSAARLQTLNPDYTKEDIHCYIADPDVAEMAKKSGKTKTLNAAEKAKPILDGGIVLIGNAPLALARIARFIMEENIKPALVIGMPVGFVNVRESKNLLLSCSVPHIVVEGNRGGSALAVATLHAVIESAKDLL